MSNQISPNRRNIFGRHQRYVIQRMLRNEGWWPDPAWIPRLGHALGQAIEALEKRKVVVRKPISLTTWNYYIPEETQKELRKLPWLNR